MIEFLIETVKSAKSVITQSACNIREKVFGNYVTSADLDAQELITQKLRQRYPFCRIIAEENTNDYEGLDDKIERSDKKITFILDPLDGTTNYKFGLNIFAVSLGCLIDEELIYGVVYIPEQDELFWAEKGKGAYLNGKRIEVNQKNQLKDCLIAVGTSPYDRKDSQKRFLLFDKIFKASCDIRRLGSAAIDLCYVACGRVDGYLEAGLRIWDYAAGMLIVQEAGGVVTDFKGKEIDLIKMQGDIVAANLEINKSLIGLMGE